MLTPRLLFPLKKSLTVHCQSNFKRFLLPVDLTSRKILQKLVHTSTVISTNHKSKSQKKEKIVPKSLMSPFEYTKNREKETFLECLRAYNQRPGQKADCIVFIKLALKYMDEFGVNKDLEVYKKLLDIFPKGTYVPKNAFQVIFYHYYREQMCAVEVLHKMEENKVCPDAETEMILINTFGKWGQPVMKCHRLTYWFPKFKYTSPWLIPPELPNSTLELAKLIIARITSVDLQSEITTYDTEEIEDAIEKTWIVSAMAPMQAKLLQKHDKKQPLFVEGPFRTWLDTQNIEYFILKAKPPKSGYRLPDYDDDDVSNIKIPQIEPDLSYIIPYPSVHEQNDGIIMAVCATGTSTKDSLLSWIRFLQKEHEALETIPVVFTLRKSVDDPMYITDDSENVKEIDDKR